MEVTKQMVYSDGHHNAWTDLAFFQNRWYITFRSGWWHHRPGHRCVYTRSTDQTAGVWEKPRGVYTLDALRRLGEGPTKLFVWDDKLWIVVHLSEDENLDFAKTQEKPPAEGAGRPFLAHSPDGVVWSEFSPLLERNRYVWRVHEHDGWLYATVFDMSYTRRRSTWLMRSRDAVNWEEVAKWHGHQTALVFSDDGTAYCTERVEEKDLYGPEHPLRAIEAGHQNADTLRWSKPPYTQWESEELGFIIHSSILEWADGRLVLSGVEYFSKPGRQTTFRVRNGDGFGPPTVLYNQGDCGYPGMMKVPGREKEVLVSFYGGEDRLSKLYSPILVERKIGDQMYYGWSGEMNKFLSPCDIYIARIELD